MQSSEQINTNQAADLDLSKINFDHLRRKQAYKTGLLDIPEEEMHTVKGKQVRKDFNMVPCVLPFKLNEESEVPKSLDCSEQNKEEFLASVKPIDLEIVSFDKPVYIIFNPNSGKKVNLIPIIEARLKKENIPYETAGTQKFGDTYEYARDFEIDNYSVLAVVGGDGSCHEVCNGLLARKDGKRIPVAFLPNGSGDDLCNVLNIHSLDDALDVLCSGGKIKIDTIRFLVDHENEEDVPEDRKFWDIRHMMVNGAVSMPCKIANTAVPWKTCCGKSAYTFAAIKEFCKCSFAHELYSIDIDGQTIFTEEKPVETIMIMIHNGSSTGAGMVVEPYAIMNDGMFNCNILTDTSTFNLMGLGKILDQSKAGGTHAYDRHSQYYRGRNMRINFHGTHKQPHQKLGPQLLGVDGEDLRFSNFVKIEAMPENIEVMFNHFTYFKEKQSFVE